MLPSQPFMTPSTSFNDFRDFTTPCDKEGGCQAARGFFYPNQIVDWPGNSRQSATGRVARLVKLLAAYLTSKDGDNWISQPVSTSQQSASHWLDIVSLTAGWID